jgi:hypothetical protein
VHVISPVVRGILPPEAVVLDVLVVRAFMIASHFLPGATDWHLTLSEMGPVKTTVVAALSCDAEPALLEAVTRHV